MKSQQDGLSPEKSAAKAGKRQRGGLTSAERHRLISEAAYERAERSAGHDKVIDWLEAEQELDECKPRAR